VNENAAYIFDIEEPKNWVFDGDHVWVAGWFISKTGAVFSDIRAVIEGVPHLGILGMPRPEIEQRYRGHAGLPHAGFLLHLRPPRRARELRIELLDAGHNWVEIWRTRIKVRRGDNTIGRLDPRVLPKQLRRLLQARRADPASVGPLAGRLALESAAVPLDTLPKPPFHGALERPELIGATQFGKVRCEGWLIHETKKIARLLASTSPFVENELDYGDRERPAAAELFPGHPHAARSQFFGMLDIDETAPGPAIVKLFAEFEDGSRQFVMARRFHARPCIEWEQPLPVFSRADFFACARIFLAACRRHEIRLRRPGEVGRALLAAYRDFQREAPKWRPPPDAGNAYADWIAANRPTAALRQAWEKAVTALKEKGPVISLVVDATDAPPGHAADLLRSLVAQAYPKWEAWFVGPGAPAPGDERCRHEKCTEAKDRIRALNAAAHQSAGAWLAFLPAGSRLAPDALLEIAERAASQPSLELIYTDEDRMDDAGRRSAPDFKPDWSPALALSGTFPGHLTALRKERFLQAGSLRDGFGEATWTDLLLRATDELGEDRITHIPLVLHHARADRPAERDPADPLYEHTRKAVAEAAKRRHWHAEPFLPELGHQQRRCFMQLRWVPDPDARPAVTIVIPTRDRLHLLQECVELLDETVDWRFAKLVIVDDHSRDADAVRYLEAIQRRADLRCAVVRPADRAAPFNYSHLVNLALPHADTPLLLHLNNDVNALGPGWLEEMAGWFVQPDVGVVGAKLIYPDRTLNHTGIVVGPHGGLADTPFAKEAESAADLRWHAMAREVSAVTGACLMTRTDLYRRLGGFDEREFGVAYNDVDYCLRVRAAGQRVLYTPQAKLMHWGSATRGVTFDAAEHIAFVRRHGAARDPFLNPHLDLEAGRIAVRGGRFARSGRAGRLRLLLLTHNLNYEGAPWFLLEYARWMAREAGFGLEVLAAQDGPLRAEFEALGAHITVVDVRDLFGAPDEEVFHARLADIKHQLDWDRIDVVVANTLMNFWGVHLAARAGKPSLLYIHESTSIRRFFWDSLDHRLHHLVEEALEGATRALFLCPATQAYYEAYGRNGNFRIVPSWVRLEDIEAFRAAHPRVETRRRLGYADDEVVIANIGTVCERKGQHIFLRAIDHFNHHHPQVKARFVMVGARPGIYLDLLKRDLARLALPNVTLVPETREVYPHFVAADMFVCTSYEESLPRVVMEAMAFRTPIVSTDVHGIPMLVGQRQDAYLVPPGDPVALSRMMWACLAKERSGKTLTEAAYSRVLREHDYARVLPFHVALAREAFLARE